MIAALGNIRKSYGTDLIFENVELAIHDADRIGLVGANGTGKTTLLNVLVKELTPDEGDVIYKSGLRIGYLRQNSGLSSGNTVLAEMRGVFSDALEAHKRMEQLAEALAESPDDAALAREYANAEAKFEARDGYNIDVNIKKVLNGMGFADIQLDMVVDGMSGGEKTRLALAKLLLEMPDLLILDEPTNHLDFSTLAWLETYLLGYRGALLVVSHDRFFLDKIATKIWEMEDAAVTEYRGNYSAYKLQKAEHTAFQMKEYQKQSAQIESMTEYARRNMARASTSKMAKSRLKQLEHIEVIKKPKTKVKAPSFSFEFDRQTVNDVLTVEDMTLRVGAEGKVIVKDISFELKRGESVGLIGANGTGKSTLLKSILNILPQAGVAVWGKNTEPGYYDQENKDMHPDDSAMEELWRRFPGMAEQQVRGMLGRVLITGEEVYKKVGSLSGGERAKLGMAILMAGRYNVLVLDEPTNHLDLPAREALEDALKKYEGTLLFVSHDRYFVNALSTSVMEIEGGRLKKYQGNFNDYIEQKKAEEQPGEESAPEKPKNFGKMANQKEVRRRQAQVRQRISELEKMIAALEEEEKEIMREIAENASDFTLISGAYERLEQVKAEHEALLLEWMDIV